MDADLPEEIDFAVEAQPDRTAAGLLVAVAETAHTVRFFETLTEGLTVDQKMVVYTTRNKIETIVASVAVGCRHTSEIQARLVPDRAAAQLFGMARFPDQSGINAFLRALGPAQVTHLAQAHARLLQANSRAGDRSAWWVAPSGQRFLPVDLDQTPLVTRSSKAQGATKGYFGRKRGQVGYKKSVALLGAGVQEVLWLRLGEGKEHGHEAVAGALEAMDGLMRAQGIRPDEVVWRGDSQYGSTRVVRQIRAHHSHFLVKGYTPRTAQHLAESVPPTAGWTCLGRDTNGSHLWLCDAGFIDLAGHDDPKDLAPINVRVVVLVRVRWDERRKRGHGSPNTIRTKSVSYEHYLTDFPARTLPAREVIAAYNQREGEEGFFQVEQDTFGADYLRTHQNPGEEAFLWLLASTVNLLRWTQHATFAHTPIETVGLRKLVHEVIRTPATLVKSASRWTIRLADLSWVARCLVDVRLTFAIQYPLPLLFEGHSP